MSMSKARRKISNSDDVIDSRDVITRIEELESEREDLEQAVEDARELPAEDEDRESTIEGAEADLAAWDEDNGDELKDLRNLAEEASGSPDWTYGETLIRDSYFVEYAQQLAEDIGAIKSDASWPNDCIDWDKAAEQLQQDYTSVEFGDTTYWIRS